MKRSEQFWRFAATTVVACAMYLLLVGSLDLHEIAFGLLTALVASVLVARFLPIRPGVLNPRRVARALAYAPYFVWKMIEANVRLALIVINPKLPIRPAMVRGRTSLISDAGKLFLTSSITLTPGTLSVEVEEAEITVHCVVANDAEAKGVEAKILAPFERRLKGVAE